MIQAFFTNPVYMVLLTGALVATAGTLVGTFLVLQRNSMLADAISHSIVFGIVVVWLLTKAKSGPFQIAGAVMTGVLTVFLTEMVARSRRVKQDAAIGIVFPVLFAAGVLLLNLYARDIHIDTHTVLLGEIGFVWLDTLKLWGWEIPQAVVWMSVATLVNLAFVLAFYKELKIATFDRQLAAALGLAPTLLFYLLLGLTSITAVAAFDAVGVVLFLAFVIVPPATAYLLTDRLSLMLLLGVILGVAATLCGYPLAVAMDVSVGGTMAAMTGVFFLAAFLLSPRYGLLGHWLNRRLKTAG